MFRTFSMLTGLVHSKHEEEFNSESVNKWNFIGWAIFFVQWRGGIVDTYS